MEIPLPCSSIQSLGYHLHPSNSCVSDDGWRMIDLQLVKVPTIVPDGWCSVMSTCELFTIGADGRDFG
jgi:hypothetical protein